MTSYDAIIQSKLGDPSKFLVSKNVQIDIKDKYVDSFRTLNEITVPPDRWDGDPDSLPFEPTSEEATMEQLDEYIGAEINLATKKWSTTCESSIKKVWWIRNPHWLQAH